MWSRILILCCCISNSAIANDLIIKELSESNPREQVLAWSSTLQSTSATLGKVLAKAHASVLASPTESLAIQRLANLYHANGYHNEASELYDWLAENAQSLEDRAKALYQKATLVMAVGETSQAIPLLRRSLALWDAYPPTHEKLGDALFKTGDFEGAAALYQSAIGLDASRSAPRFGLCRIWEREGQLERSIEELESIVQQDPRFIPALAMLSQLYARIGDSERAYRLSKGIPTSNAIPQRDDWLEPVRDCSYDLQKLDFLFLDYFLVRDFDNALVKLQRLKEIEPDNPRWKRYRGLVYLTRGYAGEALACFQEGVGMGGSREEFFPLILKALGLLKRYDEADRLVASLLAEDDSAWSDTYLEWSRLLLEQERREDALLALKQCTAASPYDCEALLLLGRTSFQTGNSVSAAEALQRVLKLAPLDHEKLLRAALVFMEAGDFAGAVPFLTKAHSAAPYEEETSELLADAYFELGNSAYQIHEFDQALRYFEKSIEVSPKRVESLAARAKAAVEGERFTQAESALEALLEVVGPHPGFLLVYGDVLYRNNDYERARQSWNNALRSLGSMSGSIELKRSLEMRLSRVR